MGLVIGNWPICANGHRGELNIASVTPQGHLNGTAFGDAIEGFWDDTAKKITFIRVPVRNTPSTYQIYTGYLFENAYGIGNFTSTLTGYFEAFQGGGGAASRSLFGWFAQLNWSVS